MQKKPPLPLTAFIGGPTLIHASQSAISSSSSSSTGSGMCFPSSKSGGGGGASGGVGGGGGSGEKQRDRHGGGGGGLCGCHKAPKSHCISATGVLLLLLLYTAMGSIIFVTLEGELEDSNSLETAVAASKKFPRTELANEQIRSRTVDRLWSITEDLNILYKENWTRLAAQEVQHFQETLLRAVRQSKLYQPGEPMNPPTHKWTYASAFLYSLTLITTIGYGGISPRTQWGRIAALIYALFGIPIVLLYLSAMGEGLSAGMRCLFRKARSKSAVSNGSGSGGGNSGSGGSGNGGSNSGNGKLPPNDSGKSTNKHYHHSGGSSGKLHPAAAHHYGLPNSAYHHSSSVAMGGHSSAHGPSVPISICVMVLVCYVTSGALLFHKLQNWSVLEALYFCFTSLGTIGFGELAPTGNLTLYLASAYILVGMAVVAMCFSLIQTEIVMWLRKFSVQDHVMPQGEDVALVSVAVTPKSS
ncbi:TWiK family of potassium channels protein 7 [Anastrepha ludens]|uniref:TWiK family of potassium channels protein 7 n=1 Tax=Anastrepha ludens TaxID=28586 RepID=UPI0023B061D0|nr:TWiK family of potassium channels protein 7 [Anastrepha ludens]